MKFIINAEKDTFFEACDVIGRNPCKLPIYEMPTALDSILVVGPLRQHGILQQFFESCLSLERDPDSLAKIKNLLHQQAKG